MNNIAKDGYIKFNHIGIIGAEKIKNSNNLWCDTKHNIWQINCGKVRDMNFNEIPNCYYVRIIGTWF